MKENSEPVVLVTGAARRLGAAICRRLHAEGMRVVIHYRNSADPAEALRRELEQRRADSVRLVQADLLSPGAPDTVATEALAAFGRLDGLVNNASTFYVTPLAEANEEHWEELTGSNLRAPYFLTRACAPALARTRGAVVNMLDIHGGRPLPGYSIYSIAKAGLAMATRALARELAPQVRVNGIAPGAILWPENGISEEAKAAVLSHIPLGRCGSPEEISAAVLFLLRDATYTSGHILPVSGGRTTGI
jgi:pteridine reductase